MIFDKFPHRLAEKNPLYKDKPSGRRFVAQCPGAITACAYTMSKHNVPMAQAAHNPESCLEVGTRRRDLCLGEHALLFVLVLHELHDRREYTILASGALRVFMAIRPGDKYLSNLPRSVLSRGGYTQF